MTTAPGRPSAGWACDDGSTSARPEVDLELDLSLVQAGTSAGR